MKILFLASQLYLPQIYGGVQTSTDDLCKALIERGHKPSLLVKVMSRGWFGTYTRTKMFVMKLLTGKSAAYDRTLGYTVWRSWDPKDVVEFVCQREKPDLIVVMTGGKILASALEAQSLGIPMLIQLHDVAFNEYGEDFKELSSTHYVANSKFTAARYKDRYDIDCAVINPFIAKDQYRVESERRNVTFINPVGPKGVDLALLIAKECPTIPFSFVEGWTLSADQRFALDERLKDVPNVTLIPSQKDMRTVYGQCKILLVPSRFEETFGRVTAEAHANGIPVIASKRGGLPESVGPAGVLIAPEASLDEWVNAVQEIWNDDQLYDELSATALEYAARQELDRDHQIDLWEDIFYEAAALPKKMA